MFSDPIFKPYRETAFQWSPDGLVAASPWMSMIVDVLPEQRKEVQTAIDHLKTPLPENSLQTQKFLSFFADFPLLNVLPRSYHGAGSPYNSEAAVLLASSSAKEFLSSINPFPEIDVESSLDYFPDCWEWDDSAIANFSRIGNSGMHDPYSVYTMLREQRLSFQVAHAHWAATLIDFLKSLHAKDEPAFFNAMAIILAQQYYVTNHCDDCLCPAVGYHHLISSEIAKYQQEELHHDRLIMKSITALVGDRKDVFQFAPEVRLEIEAIKYSAQTCALGFSALVSIMEGTVYPESDPVGDLLLASSRPEARTGVEAHFQVNKRGNHTAIPEAFVKDLPPVTTQTVTIATRLTEATIRLDAGLARTMLNKLHGMAQ